MKFLLIVLTVIFEVSGNDLMIEYKVPKVFERSGDVNIVLLDEHCKSNDNYEVNLGTTLISSAIWTVDRLNILQVLPMSLGLQIYNVCNESDYYNTIFHLFHNQFEEFTAGIITVNPLPENIRDFSEVLAIHNKIRHRYFKPIIDASIELLSMLNWKHNVTVVLQRQDIAEDLLTVARQGWVCIEKMYSFKNLDLRQVSMGAPLLFFGEGSVLKDIFVKLRVQKFVGKVIIVPLDGAKLEGVPEGYYTIQPIYEPVLQNTTKTPKVTTTPLLFDIANPIIQYTKALSNCIRSNCNNTSDTKNCISRKYSIKPNQSQLSIHHLLTYLQIEPLQSKFNYEIFQVENSTAFNISNGMYTESSSKVVSYNIFQERFIDYDSTYYSETKGNLTVDKHCSGEECSTRCLNFQSNLSNTPGGVFIRSEAWVFAFLSVSILGSLFCVAIIVFIVIRLVKKQIMEGNPTLTILLLIIVILMYLSVITFAVDANPPSKSSIIMARTLAVALPYAAAFSVVLSRIILLSTISKEIGFMSHVAGTVQAFLCLFIFGVQCALSLQIARRCQDVFHDFFVLYLVSYNIILLALMLCLSPLIFKSQRNYKEGRYFVISTALIVFCWCCWVPAYVVLREEWRDPALCSGLVATASILLCAIFIPRTYMITVSAARDRFTNALPSLAAASHMESMDIYRASTQPVYDCVNIAAVNTINSRNGVRKGSQQDLYSSPAAQDDDYQASNASVTNPDKVTRF